jgi:hypothetical protein
MKKTDLQRYYLNGKVKEFNTESFAVNIETNKVNTGYSKREYKSFNEFGMMIVIKTINPNGLVEMNLIYTYDENQNMIEAIWIEKDGSHGCKSVRKYDNFNREIEKKELSLDGSVNSTTITKFDELGLYDTKEIDSTGRCRSHRLQWRNPETNIIETHSYNEFDKLWLISWKNTLDENGSFETFDFDEHRNPKKKSLFLNDKYGHSIEFHEQPINSKYDNPIHCFYKNEYDEAGNLLCQTCTRENGEIRYKHEYKLDKFGNAIEQLNYEPIGNGSSDKLFWVIYKKNTIVYY